MCSLHEEKITFYTKTEIFSSNLNVSAHNTKSDNQFRLMTFECPKFADGLTDANVGGNGIQQ